MPCIIALIIFGIMGIFSASHRALAREAFSCVLNRVTFRPCNSSFKDKIKGKILSKLINKSVFLTRIVNKNYELLSWVFFILVVGSTLWTFNGLYNFYVYGSCNGLNQTGFCAFDPTGENNKVSSGDGVACGTVMPNPENVTLNNVDLSIFPSINNNSQNDIVLVGCYGCDYTRASYPNIKKLIDKKSPNYTFVHLPTKGDSRFLSDVGYCVYRDYKDKFWEFNDYLFETDKEYILNKNNTIEILNKFNFDVDKINTCINEEETKNMVEKQLLEAKKMNIYGTPTLFINKKPFIGPKPYRVYNSAINKFIFF